MVDVARHAGVSLKTVSRVVNGEPTVNAGLAERVLASIGVLGFQRNQLASTLRAGRRTGTVGLVIEELANPFYSTIASVAAEVAAQHDTMLITASSEEDPDLERRLVFDLCSRRVDGLLLVPASGDHAYLRPEVDMGVHVVFLDRPGGGGLEADTVLIDNRGGARAAVDALLAKGHRRIAVLLDSTGVYTMRERLLGAREAMESVDAPLTVVEGVANPDDAARAVAGLLDGPQPPTAFFTVNNRLTVGAVGELWRRGDDAELAGFDDFELAHLMPRPLTVVAYDTRAMAGRATEMLFERVRGERAAARTEVIGTRLVARGVRR
ncbi:LacI family transcriptional regulator [Actinorhabdospora filicis]|uniref:LacI family transcriptional regulator n=1 Tax=Actinorhabdospora filicis TaxID=1785913 RepID=A0A9W6W6U2_9ACTN|nr:LacI family DNA-binding transcriptional regulator [Actinorhabdospora filicis]GLZ81922.1 LacI family transcriptional regulator [Actinorhabdospora filicis]